MENKINNTVERIIQYINYKSISKREFAKEIGVSHSLIGKSKTIGSDKLEKILSVYSEISAEWLISGIGSMLKHSNEEASMVKEEAEEYKIGKDSNEDADLKKEIAYQKKIIDLLERENKLLRSKVGEDEIEDKIDELKQMEEQLERYKERGMLLHLKKILYNEIQQTQKEIDEANKAKQEI